jgi:starch synthase (maltosyl-transferring)
MSAAGVSNGRVRAVIDAVRPAIDGGRFAVKRVTGEALEVEAHCFADGHDVLRAKLAWRNADAAEWQEIEMKPLGNDVWRAQFTPIEIGRYRYTVAAWVDAFATWRHDFARREDPADQALAALAGAYLAEEAAARAKDAHAGADAQQLKDWAKRLRAANKPEEIRVAALDEAMALLATRHPDRSLEARWETEMPLVVERERARYSTWYELFPRSTAAEPGKHGTFKDVEKRLPYVAELGFDVLYLPPIHPVGRERRKGKNNAVAAKPDEVGSPWAIGATEGGHKSILPALGTPEEFRRLVKAAAKHGIEIALDIAFQCAPDHPYVKQHPDWFRKRPDGSVQYAENPPKKYQDIYPFDFECADWQALWQELKSVFEFWVGEGVKIFRVDNPHTKAFPFWEWVIAEVKRAHPDVIFLAEAFTRPKVMHRLAKLGYTQSYTYFAWRNTKQELTEYFTELSKGPGRDYFRPNVWPNTPDILTESLQVGGRPAFMQRLALAATLAASYGIYGPAYELMEHLPRDPGSEEYLNSEKYEVRHWDLERPDSLRAYIAAFNRIRRENPALHEDTSLRFFPTDNDQLLAYGKQTPDRSNQIVCVVNLSPHHAHGGWVELDLAALGIESDRPYQMHDLLSGARYMWTGPRNFVQLDPQRSPVHVFRVRGRLHREQDFDYFL